jgi:hypothetical protein
MTAKYSTTASVLALLLALLLSINPAMGEYQTVSLRNYNVSLDFGDKEVAMEPMYTSSTRDTILHSITFRGYNRSDYATIYLYEYQVPQTFDLKDRFWKAMKAACTMVDIDPATISGSNGFIGTGYARVSRGFGKQVCYGGIIALPSGTVAKRDFMIMAHFFDEALNEHLVKTVQVEYVGKTVEIKGG